LNTKTKKIFLFQNKEIQQWEVGEITRINKLLRQDKSDKLFSIVDNFDDADYLVLIESCILKSQKNIDDYRELFKFGYSNGKKLLVINYEDTPSGILPGFYSSLEQKNFDNSIHRSWPHLRMPNELIDNTTSQISVDADLLFSFSGSCSHPVRKKIFDTYSGFHTNVSVNEIKRWYNHDSKEKLAYVDEITRSKFVLCPHGIASYSHRILETLALGHIPVIIADNWIPFSIKEKDYYIQIKESNINKIEEILVSYLPNYTKINENARYVYAKYFNYGSRYTLILNELVKLEESMINDFNSYFLIEKINSSKFWKANGWLISQRINNLCLINLKNLIKYSKLLIFYIYGKK
jgi:Exostosin family